MASDSLPIYTIGTTLFNAIAFPSVFLPFQRDYVAMQNLFALVQVPANVNEVETVVFRSADSAKQR